MDITELDAIPLSRAIHDRTVSCREVMAAYLARIDAQNPRVNAIVSRVPHETLLAQADERDRELAAGRSRGWMHGMPQAIKDTGLVRGMPSTKGSPLLADFVPAEDSVQVARMRASGALIVGRTNVPEFGLGSNTYNTVFGATGNAYDPGRTAGGSSGGAAAALALRMLPVADGSDVGGSLRNPAAFNNVFGMRPSQGRVPYYPAPDVWMSQLGTEGPMGRTVEDVARLLSVQAGYDRRAPLSLSDDPACFAQPLVCEPRGLRIGYVGDLGGYLPLEEGVDALCRAALPAFASLGCEVDDQAAIGFDPARLWDCWIALRSVQTSGPLLDFDADPAKRARLKPEACWEVDNARGLSAFDVFRAATVRSQWYQQVCRLFERYDFLLQPTAQVFPFPLEQHWPREVGGRAMDTYHRWMEIVIPWTLAGLPALNVPAGFGGTAGLPMGLQLIGPPRGDLAVLQLGAAYDAATGWVRSRRPAL
ncbi:MAG TPA: amidase [Burkholderiaceae bacterium]|nr:amidase [Burkholderiaceae bacterium]